MVPLKNLLDAGENSSEFQYDPIDVGGVGYEI